MVKQLKKINMKAKFLVSRRNTENKIFIVDVPDNLIVQEFIVNRLAEISLIENESEQFDEKRYEELETELELKIDELIRPTLIQNGLVEPNSNYRNCDIAIDGINVSDVDILNEDVALIYDVTIF